MKTKKKAKVFVGICSARQYKERRAAVRETWFSQKVDGIEARFFLGHGDTPLEDDVGDIIELDAADDYNSLPAKVFAFFQYALANYDFDWLLKCDDDTYLVQERVHSLLNENADFIGDISLQERDAPSGGAGYFLSRRLVEKMVGIERFPTRGAEDVIVGELALYKFNALYLVSHRLCIDCSRIPLSFNNAVSAHWCSPKKLREIHELYKKTEVVVYLACHPCWTDDVYFFKDGFFMRKTSGCKGVYHEDKDKVLHLKWTSWGEETLKGTEYGYSNGKFILIRREILDNRSTEKTSIAEKNKKTIPKIIHQFVSDDNQVPELQQRCLSEWKNFAEKYGFEYRLWTPEKIKNMIKEQERHDWAELISGSKDYGQYGDLCRFMLLHIFGGWWADWDISIIHSETLAEFLGKPFEKITIAKDGYLCVEFIGAPRGDFVVEKFLASLFLRRNNRGSTVEFAGPHGFTKFIDSSANYDDAVAVFPVNMLFQAGFKRVKAGARPSNEAKPPLFHYWGHIWMDKEVNPEHLNLPIPNTNFQKLIRGNAGGQIASPRFLIAICSAAPYIERRKACRDTWLERLPADVAAFFFVGKSAFEMMESNVVVLDVPDNYNNLTRKIKTMFLHVLNEYDFEYLVKCDDDTYMVPERLSELTKGAWGVIGYVWNNGKNFLSGGAGYMIRRDCLSAIVNAMNEKEDCEDVAVTRAARSLGIAILNTERLQYGPGKFPRVNNNKISSHWCKPEDMRKIHENFVLSPEEIARENARKTANTSIELKKPIFSLRVYHSCWNDTLLFFDNGIFGRTQTACRGLWKKDKDGVITLDWFDWGTEYLYPDCIDSARYAFFVREDKNNNKVVKKNKTPSKAYANWGVCAVAIPRESYYWLKDWIAHHVAAGASKVVIYDNTGSSGSMRPLTEFANGRLQQAGKTKRGEEYGKLTAHLTDEQIRCELETIATSFKGKVEIVTWQPTHPKLGAIIHGQVEAYCDFIRRYQTQLGWGAFLDLDEYLYCTPGLTISNIIKQIEFESPSISVVQIRPWRFESRWTNSGPSKISELTKHALIDGVGTSKSFVRLRDVTHANIHLQWRIRDGCFRVFAVPEDFGFCHYNHKVGTLESVAQLIRPREFLHVPERDGMRLRVLAPFPSVEYVEPLPVETTFVQQYKKMEM